ncbi:hypothetical protein C4K37_4110 [Pseudomonas chlororaphis subsp. piscium]|nr:hypothetical protein C4K37_4110 [Pseudomonas chlororaphis subsp. piscium]AZD87141.1 hypothetical protein C4K14_4321 [Pseudomonas chlororaphis subsp. aureofaciens]AZC45043.1 hypothetical protein C4K36_4122 [Pseudomonas chlororaphis subsp. piscium]AZC51533.1 hypothetical protein C4K35_3954 [Pseudomonas chlororaphis subsp. piscium]AZC58138.1 hypothetical protein C4K34_3977 [Pseudomonas chlororaphis subsp. piscium]
MMKTRPLRRVFYGDANGYHRSVIFQRRLPWPFSSYSINS